MTEETAEQRLRRIATARAAEARAAARAQEAGPGRRREREADAPERRVRRAPEETASVDVDEEDWEDDDEESQSFLQNVWGGIKEILLIAVMALVLSFVVKTWLIQAFYIPSGSMENTLVKDDRVIVSKLTPGPFDLRRGDVVVFKDPGNWLGTVPEEGASTSDTSATVHRALQFIGLVPDDSDDHLIKRVIGLPGDHVVCCDKNGELTINGVSINEPYIRSGDTPAGGKPNFDITVPAGRVWVMGDHRSDSSDSRFHDDGTGATGSVPIDDITGRAVMLVWPIDHVKWLSVPERIYADVPAPTGRTVPTVGPSKAPTNAPTGAAG